MSTMTGERQSPGWRKPSDVMKIRKKKKPRRGTPSLPSLVPGRGDSSPQRPGIVLKRRNPFGCGGGAAAVKRKLSEDSGDKRKVETAQMEQKHHLATPSGNEKNHQAPPSVKEKEVNGVDQREESSAIDGVPTEEEKCHHSSTCPIDWCLHTRVRFTSQVGFDWASRISSLEESRGLTNFVRCKTTPSDQDMTEDSVFRERLKQATKVWSSPSLPWFKSFPRIVPESKDARTTFIVKEENVQKSLMAHWCESFCSVYQLLRADICPYFYVCAHHLTILFRAKHVAGRDSVHAFLGPTTRGFRESLKAEGVTFTMPLLKEEVTKHKDPHQKLSGNGGPQPPSSLSQDDNCQQEEEMVEGDEDSEAASWLESIGLDNFLEMSVHKVQLQADTSAKQDNRPQSVLFVEGFGNVQALYNFILNYKNIVATVGLQAGIPPTILAPTAFHGATLSSCKVKSSCLRQVIGRQVNDIHTLDVSGPVLPHTVHQLTRLLSETQQGQFTAAFQAHGPTGAFTAASHRTFTESGGALLDHGGTPVEHGSTSMESRGTLTRSGGTLVAPEGTETESGGTSVESEGTSVGPEGTSEEHVGTSVDSGRTSTESDGTSVAPDSTSVELGRISMESGNAPSGQEVTHRAARSCAGFSGEFNAELFRPLTVIEKAWKELKYVDSEYRWL